MMKTKPTSMTREELTDLANNLTLNDMCGLINRFSENMVIYIGCLDTMIMEIELSRGEVIPATMNGCTIQLNSELTNFEDMRDDKHFAYCLNQGLYGSDRRDLILSACRGSSQNELAKQLGVSGTQITKWKQGEKIPADRVDQLIAIVKRKENSND